MIPLVMSIIAKTETFQRDMARARGHVGKFESSVKKSNITLTGFSRSILRLAGVGGGLYLLQRGLRGSIKEASRAEETFAKFDVVFRNQAKSARKWAEEYGDSVGRATHKVAEWMAGLQDTFVPLGIARDKAADLSKSLVTLAVDVASFNNKMDADVIRDFTSALVGNHETVRKFGIIISESAIKQEALRQGLNKTYSELTDLEKVQLRYSLIMRGTVDAQGDAIRTGDSYANQVKRLNDNLAELAVTFGKEFLPVLSDFIKILNENKKTLEFFAKWARGFVELATGFSETRKAITELSEAMRLVPEKPQRYGMWAPSQFYGEPRAPVAPAGRLPSGRTVAENVRIAEERAVQLEAEDLARKRAELRLQMEAEQKQKAEFTGFEGPVMPEKIAEQRQKQAEMAKFVTEAWMNAFKNIESGMSDSFHSMIMEGTSFKEAMSNFAMGIADSFARMASDIAARSIMGAFGFGAGWQQTGTAKGPGGIFQIFGSKAHSGGIVGQTPFQMKALPAAAFMGAPRLHSGLMSDEFPAILQKGEEVVPKGGGNIGRKLDTLIAVMSQRQTINANIIDSRDIITRERIEGREGEGWTMNHIQRNS